FHNAILCYRSLPSPSLHAAPTQIYTLSLHDALPIYSFDAPFGKLFERRLKLIVERLPDHPKNDADVFLLGIGSQFFHVDFGNDLDRKSTRLNSSHGSISYAVFCLKKKNTTQTMTLSL